VRLNGKVAVVTGGGNGIGAAIGTRMAQEGAAVAVVDVDASAAGKGASFHLCDVTDEDAVAATLADVVARHGRLDVLVNNAGVGIGATVAEIETKRLDMQLDINLRQIVLFYRECVAMLRDAGAEHRNALVVNTSSISGKRAEGWLSIYSATKHGVVGWTEAMNKELGKDGIKSTALCPAFVDTPMTDFVKEHVAADEMIRPEDIAESVRYLLKTSPACVVPEIMFIRPGDSL